MRRIKDMLEEELPPPTVTALSWEDIKVILKKDDVSFDAEEMERDCNDVMCELPKLKVCSHTSITAGFCDGCGKSEQWLLAQQLEEEEAAITVKVEPPDLEVDLQTALELLGRVSDMFSFIDHHLLRKLLGTYHWERMLNLDTDVATFLNAYDKD